MKNLTEYEISCDKSRLDIDAIHAFLRHSYWSAGIPRHVVEAAVENSLCFGVYHGADQVGFGRIVTDKATFAYLSDVYVLEPHRGRGLGKKLIAFMMAREELQGLRRFMLATSDAHGLYSQFGFRPLATPERLMEILVPDAYQAG